MVSEAMAGKAYSLRHSELRCHRLQRIRVDVRKKAPNPLGVYLRTMRKPQHESELPLFDAGENAPNATPVPGEVKDRRALDAGEKFEEGGEF